MDRNLALELTRITKATALSTSSFMGKSNSQASHRSVPGVKHAALNSIFFLGTIVSGEADKTLASKLCRGATVGCGHAPEWDFAVDPLEGTCSVTYGRANVLSVEAVGPEEKIITIPLCLYGRNRGRKVGFLRNSPKQEGLLQKRILS